MLQNLKRSVFLGIASLSVLLVGVATPAAALGAQRYTVQGGFQTLALTCPPPDDTEQCVIDQLSGSLVGTNKLVTVDFVENDTTILYEDTTLITVTGGQFAGMTFSGTEFGKINKQTGEFSSVAFLMSTDGCGSTLRNVNHGVIDLDTLEDSGSYTGRLVKRSCN